jgi:fucose permease
MIRKKLTSDKLFERIITLTIIFLLVFFGVTILSYYLLPEGFLLNKNNGTNFNTSTNIIICTLQIFAWNMISVVAIFIGSLFSKKNNDQQQYLSLSYLVFIVLILLSAITLGTWSFSFKTESVPLLERIISMFHITERAGLVELYGMLLITCSLANKSLVMSIKNKTITKKMKDIKWNKKEIICAVCGMLLMLIAAFIESKSIIG